MTYVSAVLRGFSCSIVVAGLSACTYLIPDDVSAPRYNMVLGDRHKPVRNTTGNGASLGVTPSGVPLATAAPIVPVAVSSLAVPIPSSIQYTPIIEPSPMVPTSSAPAPTLRSIPLPPVAPEVEAKAKQLTANTMAVASNTVVMTRQVPLENPGAPVALNDTGRHAPVENKSFMLAQNSPSQGLMNVPARPVISGPDSASSRLMDARQDLEASRANTAAAKEQLGRDVAAEPSVFATPAPAAPEALSPLPTVAAPVPVPAAIPAPKVVTPKPAASFVAPVPLTPPPPLPPIQLSSPAPLETPAAAPVASTRVASGARSFDPMAALPPQAPALAPIQLTPPAAEVVETAPVAVQSRAEAPPAASALGATTSAFNPLAGANVSASSTADANLHYLSPSRYAYRR